MAVPKEGALHQRWGFYVEIWWTGHWRNTEELLTKILIKYKGDNGDFRVDQACVRQRDQVILVNVTSGGMRWRRMLPYLTGSEEHGIIVPATNARLGLVLRNHWVVPVDGQPAEWKACRGHEKQGRTEQRVSHWRRLQGMTTTKSGARSWVGPYARRKATLWRHVVNCEWGREPYSGFV